VPAVTRAKRTLVAALAGLIVVLLVLAVIGRGGGRSNTITAEFAEAPGLYVGNRVDVLGIPVGHVTRVKVEPGGVSVTMKVPAGIKIPQQAEAVLMAPEVVNDRYVQLSPAYTGGPVIADGAQIPLERTVIPVSVDRIVNTLDQFAQLLGPQGANKTGALSDLLHSLALSFGGNGPELHSEVVSFSQAMSALAANPAQLTAVLNNLGNLTQAAAAHTGSYQSLAQDLASVSGSLAADSTDIASALSNLQTVFSQLASFVANNQSTIGASLTNLSTFASALAQQQQQLAHVIDVGPLALNNLSNAIDPNAPGGPALKGRYDGSGDSKGFVQQVCGNVLYRGLILATNPSAGTQLDVGCLLSSTLTALPTPPGASAGPDLSLGALVKGTG
jgi:phospholipid/cholesterol/gamma-HCH transport system substrate-binding protein